MKRRVPAPEADSNVLRRDHRRRLWIAGILLVFAAVYMTLGVVAHSRRSGTWDEPMHLASGYAALADGNYLVDPSHPPFARMWAAAPLLVMPDVHIDRDALDRTTSPRWLSESYEFARRFVYVGNDANTLLFASRSMMMLWGLALGLLIFAWTYEWLGLTPAVLALTFFTIEPNLAAHASLVTTDAAVACAMFGAMYFLWRTCRRPARSGIAGASLCAAMAAITKFSGLIVLPIILLTLAVHVLYTRTLAFRQAARIAAAAALAVYVTVWAVYGFRYAPGETPGQTLRFDRSTQVRQNAPLLAPIAGWIDDHRLLPNAFTQGLLYSQASARELPGYLAGHYSADGWWYYFPVAFSLKTPAALLLLFGAGLIVLVRRRTPPESSGGWFVLVPPAIYLAAAMISGINVGVRHILPIYPFVLLVAAAGAARWIASSRRVARPAFAAVTAFWLFAFAMAYPNTLAFFNRLAGGPHNGSRMLTDSNLDWGQHLKVLKRWMDDNGVAHVNLAYFGTADPAYYGIKCTHLPGAPAFAAPDVMRPRLPGYVAISATIASGVYLDPRWRLFYRPFADRMPVADIGHSIRVYWVERWPEPAEAVQGPDDIEAHRALADALLFGQQWIDLAIVHYRAYLRHRPADGEAMTRLGVALAAQNNAGEAISVLRRAVTLVPDSGRSQRVLAEVLLAAGQAADAGKHAERAVELTPTDPAAHDVLGVILVLRGRPLEARTRFESALSLDAEYAPARDHLERVNALIAGRRAESP